MNKQKTSMRYGEMTHTVVKYEAVENSEAYDSVAHFIEKATRKHAKSLRGAVAGGRQIRTLIGLLNDIPGIEEDKPEISVVSTIKGEKVSDKVVTIELGSGTRGVLNDINDRTGMSRSKIIRFCVFRELDQTLEHAEPDPGWRVDEVKRTFGSIQNSLIIPLTGFHEILHRRFVALPGFTNDMIEQDPESFNDFAQEYRSEFYQSDPYKRIEELFGEQTLEAVEDTIERHTDIKFGLAGLASLYDLDGERTGAD